MNSRTPSPSKPLLARADTLRKQGDWRGAELAYRELLRTWPDSMPAWYGLALALEGSRRLADAIDALRRAVALQPAHPVLHHALGLMQHAAGAVGSAREALEEAVRLDPAFVHAWNQLGLVLQDLRDDALAEAAFRQALAIRPAYAPALVNLGQHLLMTQRAEAAIPLLQQAMNADRGAHGLHPWLAHAHLLCGRRDDAAKALADGGVPASEVPCQLARLLSQQMQFDAGRAGWMASSRADASNWRAHFEGLLGVPAIYRDEAHLATVREGYRQGLREMACLAKAQTAFDARMEEGLETTSFFLAYQGRNDIELQRDRSGIVAHLLQLGVEPAGRPTVRRHERLRIGFVSSFFRNCTVGHYFKSWITELDRGRFETYTYLLDGIEDDVTGRIGAASTRWMRLEGTLPDLVRQVRHDQLDAVVFPELGMHGRTYALASLRLAPVQCAAWGHPVTSGHAAVDYYISCAGMEPPDAQDHYAEQLVLLPGLGTCYDRPEVGKTMTRRDFGLPEGRPLYFFPHALFKILPENDAVLVRLLQRDPDGMLVLCAGETPWMTRAFMARLSGRMREAGVDPDRARILPCMPRSSYLELNRLCDVMLDASRWSGGNTSLDALAAGLPIVTRPGAMMRGRQSMFMLQALGVPELVAEHEAAYLDLALRVAHDAAWRSALRERIQRGLPDLFSDRAPIRALEAFLLQACERRRMAT